MSTTTVAPTTPEPEPGTENFILAMLVLGISFACIIPTIYHCLKVRCYEHCRRRRPAAAPMLPTTTAQRNNNGRTGARILPAPPPFAQRTSVSAGVRAPQRVSAAGATLADVGITIKKSACIIITLPETLFLEPIMCPICLCVTASGRELVCKHQFHTECIETWLNTSKTCPSCRAQV